MPNDKSTGVVEIEIDNRGRNVQFPATRETIRGRYSVAEHEVDPAAALFQTRYPRIPGQRIALDVENRRGYVRDPLGDDPKLVDFVVEAGFAVPPAERVYEDVDVDAWSFWIARLVGTGKARLTAGTVPEVSPTYEPPEPNAPGGEARRREYFKKNPVLAMQYAVASAAEKKTFDQLLGLA
jgi:hypothetical protein